MQFGVTKLLLLLCLVFKREQKTWKWDYVQSFVVVVQGGSGGDIIKM